MTGHTFNVREIGLLGDKDEPFSGVVLEGSAEAVRTVSGHFLSEVIVMPASDHTDMLAALKEAHSALDRALGDTDIDYVESDEELREEEPVQWAAMRIAQVLARATNGGRDDG